MPLGMIVLGIVAVLIFLGFGQRVLDRLRLDDKTALIFIAAMLVGGFLPDITLGGGVSINIGGGLIPLILVAYLIVKAGTPNEKVRAVVAGLITGVLVFTASKIFPTEPTYNVLLDPLYGFAIIAGVVGYLAGRSRRSAFIAGVTGIVLNDIFAAVENTLAGVGARIVVGGAGIFDAVVISGFLALGLAEVFGELRERLQGGPSLNRPIELLKGLSDEETGDMENNKEEDKKEEDKDDD